MTATTRDYVSLTVQKRELDAASRKLAEQIEAIETELLDRWVEEGKSSETVDGYTVYLNVRQWARPKGGDRQAVVRALEALGMADMVTYNTQTLSGWYRERAEAGEEVPPTLAEVVDLSNEYGLNVRKKGK